MGTLNAGDLVEVDLSGERKDAAMEPSRESRTHAAIYRARPDVRSVFHAHAPWTIVCASKWNEIPTRTLHAKSKLGSIPVLRVESESGDLFVSAVDRLLAASPRIKGFVQGWHGLFSLGETIPAALYGAELIEETAKIAVLSLLLEGR